MTFTVRHWKRSYQHDHEGSTLAEAVETAMVCASDGDAVDESTLQLAAARVRVDGKFTYLGQVYQELR